MRKLTAAVALVLLIVSTGCTFTTMAYKVRGLADATEGGYAALKADLLNWGEQYDVVRAAVTVSCDAATLSDRTCLRLSKANGVAEAAWAVALRADAGASDLSDAKSQIIATLVDMEKALAESSP